MHPQQDSERFGNHYDSVAEVGEVDHEERQWGHSGQQQLVSPLQVEHIVSKAEEDHAADGKQRTYQLHKL